MLELLLRRGADPNAIRSLSFSPVELAVMRGRWSNALVLAEVSDHESLKIAAALRFDQNQRSGRTDLQNRERLRLIKIILAKGVDMAHASAERIDARQTQQRAVGL